MTCWCRVAPMGGGGVRIPTFLIFALLSLDRALYCFVNRHEIHPKRCDKAGYHGVILLGGLNNSDYEGVRLNPFTPFPFPESSPRILRII